MTRLIETSAKRRRALRISACLALVLAAVVSIGATSPNAPQTRVVVATYNIRHGRGMDDSVRLTRTGEAIRALGADIIGLQEVDSVVPRSGSRDEAHALGEQLGMEQRFGRFMAYQGGAYGMAILSRFPIRRSHALRLPDGNEPRIALLAEVELPSGARVLVANVHFDWVANDSFRVAQVHALAAVLDTVQLPTILLGDFNDVPGTRTLARFQSRFRVAAKPDADHFTFSSTDPVKEIDHILLAPAAAWRPAQARVISDRIASDHRPVVAAVELIARR
ncbi:MAG: endonuclease/exonuclease/phosphatase family protein [Gemmatimonadaceae bacterium]|nr:endonuclease/exonuclease/phosphatase family protein [Gemmatimonadaceae bacterium]